MVKRKKHDKDKYYNLARQQGYRARSAFKLIQLNKKYDFLTSAKVCIDLCAAPGGWCQVAAKYMPVSSIILGIDLLPIRPIPNVKTYVCDITTARCRQIIKQELQTWQADVVLCDGAPNVGAEYSKDAYVQNELALIALKLAVDVLGKDGTFVTKVFRSQDYNALLWVFKQLFKKVSATKPLSSRNESAEIFVVCEKYLAPQSIDPKILDPKHVFSQLDADDKGVNIFHPKYGQRKRHREGYDDSLGMTLTKSFTVGDFINASDAIQMLTDANEIKFSPEDKVYKENKKTTPEIITCLEDIKVLGKGDFKSLLKWRDAMINVRNTLAKKDQPEAEKTDEISKPSEEVKAPLTEAEKEQAVTEELAQIRADELAKKKRLKKKARENEAKLRLRSAMGMDINNIEVPQDDSLFNLKNLGLSKDKVDALENAGNIDDSSDADDESNDSESDGEDSGAELDTYQDDLDDMYETYLHRRGDKERSKAAKKRSKIAKRAIAGEALVEDHEFYDGDVKAYQKLLEVEKSSDESEDDMIHNPIPSSEKDSAVVARWFSGNKLLEDISKMPLNTSGEIKKTSVSDDSSDSEVEMVKDNDGDLVPSMPKTEKQKRKEKRKVTAEKKQKKLDQQLVRARKRGEIDDMGTQHEVVEDEAQEIEVTAEMRAKKELIRKGFGRMADPSSEEASAEIEVVAAADPAAYNFGLETKDNRKYDSDHEEYDIEDRAHTLAIASMMLRKHKAKDLIDASYNRYAWNDPEDLPDWFIDDEEKHYRAQVPVSKDVINQMRDKFMEMATKPLKKVAEARARKKRKQMKALKSAKKKANDIANLPDMSTREKLKAIEKTMKKAELKKQSKVYVVSRRNGSTSEAKGGKKKGGKGPVKLVDSRMKSDKRNAEKKMKRGKKRRRG